MQGNGEDSNLEEYIQGYAEFINRNKIELFFELDVDSVVGLKKVEYLREKLEDLTGKASIPVWHKSRGVGYFEKMCERYKYVAIGGIVSREIDRETYKKAFPYFINTAHAAGCKIHGLGYTEVAGLHTYKFDSVDSTAWLYGNRGGYLYIFNEAKGIMEQHSLEGHRLKSHEAAVHNYNEWQKFQDYAEKYL